MLYYHSLLATDTGYLNLNYSFDMSLCACQVASVLSDSLQPYGL